MAEFSGPWSNVALPDVQYGRLFSSYGTGVLGDPYNAPGVSLTAAANGIVLQPFQAVIRGRLYVLDAAQTFTPAAPSSQSRIDRLVIRYNPATGSARPTWVQGTPSSIPSVPALTQAADGTWDMPKAQVRVNPSAPTLTGLFVDQPFQALPTITCTSNTRPGMNGTPTPRAGQPIWDVTLGQQLTWTGSQWAPPQQLPAQQQLPTIPKMLVDTFAWPEPNPSNPRFNSATGTAALITVTVGNPGWPYRVGCYVQAEVGTVSTGTRWDLQVQGASAGFALGDTFLIGMTVGAGSLGQEILTPQTTVSVPASANVISGASTNVAISARRAYGSADAKINVAGRSLVVYRTPA